MYNMSKKLDENEIQIEREIAQDVCAKYDLATIVETDEICLHQEGYYIKGIEVFNKIRKHIKEVADIKEVVVGKELKPYRLSMARQNMIIDL